MHADLDNLQKSPKNTQVPPLKFNMKKVLLPNIRSSRAPQAYNQQSFLQTNRQAFQSQDETEATDATSADFVKQYMIPLPQQKPRIIPNGVKHAIKKMHVKNLKLRS